MSRYIDPVTQYFLNNGDAASDGLLYFYENLDYLTLKNTFNIAGSVNTNPVVLDGSGRIPEIAGDGFYSVRLVSAAGVTQWTVDNYNMSTGASTPSLVNPVITGNITLATSGAKIVGDFSSTTPANRSAIQSSVTNGRTWVDVLPNGTSTIAQISIEDKSDRSGGRLRIQKSGYNSLIYSEDAAPTDSSMSIIAGYSSFDLIGATGALEPSVDDANDFGSASYRLASIYAANGTIQTSDERTKTNIQSCALGLDFINSLNPVSYKFIVGSNKITSVGKDGAPPTVEPIPGKRTHYGLLAQQVKTVVDAAGVDFGGWILTKTDDPDSKQGLRYDQFIAPLIKAVQDLSNQNMQILLRIEALEALANP